jgi:putative ATPase
VVHASEDVGLADPSALTAAVNAAHALELVGLPEARINLAQATIHLALAPKSNAVIRAIDAATADVRAGRTGSVPKHLRDTHYAGSRKIGNTGYRYPHDLPGRVVAQQYAPDPVVGREYYSPGDLGVERVVRERLAGLREVLRGQREVDPEDVASGFRPRTTQNEEST